mmetsp:Transcript_8538/g.19662  ORF Transcript_8538/g.19662 Transcript_8538/m.19662 type:complete len:256 (+) Transcript_8538:1219-1986(+)
MRRRLMSWPWVSTGKCTTGVEGPKEAGEPPPTAERRSDREAWDVSGEAPDSCLTELWQSSASPGVLISSLSLPPSAGARGAGGAEGTTGERGGDGDGLVAVELAKTPGEFGVIPLAASEVGVPTRAFAALLSQKLSFVGWLGLTTARVPAARRLAALAASFFNPSPSAAAGSRTNVGIVLLCTGSRGGGCTRSNSCSALERRFWASRSRAPAPLRRTPANSTIVRRRSLSRPLSEGTRLRKARACRRFCSALCRR